MYWYLLNAFVVILFLVLSTRKYKSVLNPIGFSASFYLIGATLAPMIYQSLGLFFDISTRSVIYASILSSIYFACFGGAVVMKFSPIDFFFRGLFRWIPPLNTTITNTGTASVGMFLQFLASFALLMVASGAGLLWITDSRTAYQGYRASVGVIWAFAVAVLILAFLCIIFQQKKLRNIALTTVLCAFLVSFLGSKGEVVFFFLIGLTYTNFCIRKIPNRTILLAGIVLFALALGSQILQGTAADLLDTLLYYDYFKNSAALLDRISDIGLYHGSLSLSTLWKYVPRAIYPAKPFAYAEGILTNVLFPGAAEKGNTPGMMPWILGYGDFGVLGVCIYGLFNGFFVKAAYELFLERKDIQSFILFAQIGMTVDVFLNAPLPIYLAWLICEMMFIRAASRFCFVFFLRGTGRAKEELLVRKANAS